MRTAVALLFLTLTTQLPADEVKSFHYADLTAGQSFEIKTTDRVYRGELVNKTTGECVMTASWDGEHFSEAKTVFLLGATQGKQSGFLFVRMHEVKVGMRLELGMGDLDEKNRHVTDPVVSIRLLDRVALHSTVRAG